MPEPTAVRVPLPVIVPLSVNEFPLLFTVAVCAVATAMLLAMFKPNAIGCNVLLAVTLMSPAPSAALFPTCSVTPLKVVPTVPDDGP